MLTRREKLLVRPWQLRRYNNHKKKVLTALPAIDFSPPPERGHVTCKLKKLQWEGERKNKIEADNFRLLQRMGAIMKKNRLDNHWETPPPTFLSRVGIYHRTRSPSPYEELSHISDADTPATRKSRCTACAPSPVKPKLTPEPRIPWDPPKKSFSKTQLNLSSIQPPSDFDIRPSPKPKLTRSQSVSVTRRKSEDGLPTITPRQKSKSAKHKSSGERFVLQQGGLQLAVNFPPDSDVKISCGREDKYIQKARDCKHCSD